MSDAGERYCLVEGLDALGLRYGSGMPPPWAPGQYEEISRMERVASFGDKTWCMSEVDIFRDLSAEDMDAISAAAPMTTFPAGDIVYSPGSTAETLYILKSGRVRIFEVSADGRVLTTAIAEPGTIFGEMAVLGQRMSGNYAEALEEALVCLMNGADVRRFLLSDPRIAARITEMLGSRLMEM